MSTRREARISIHALLAESDRLWTILYSCPGNFYPRSPCGERRYLDAWKSYYLCDFYPRSPCGERRILILPGRIGFVFLSTLSLRRATILILPGRIGFVFLSTLSLRRATRPAFFDTARHIYFYPRSPCGERPQTGLTYGDGQNISIHALLAESDTDGLFFLGGRKNFYPRSPCGERH